MDLENGECRPEEHDRADVSHHYDGTERYYKGHPYLNPTSKAPNLPTPIPKSDTILHRDFLGRIKRVPKDLARYISPTHAKAFHLIVQATPKAYNESQGEWRRTSLIGNANSILQFSVWAGPLSVSSYGRYDSVQLEKKSSFRHIQFSSVGAGITQKYARRVRNSDTRERPIVRWRDGAANLSDPPPTGSHSFDESSPRTVNARTQGGPFEVSGILEGLLHPQKLVTKQQDGHWEVSDGTPQPYIVLSYAASHFPVDAVTDTNPQLEQIAEDIAKDAGVEAYWLDIKCRAKEQPEMTEDVHRICDVFRGARQVYAVVPDLSLESKQLWGSRMWCLPEALLCFQQQIVICSPMGRQVYTKCELADEVWTDGETTRLLAEHYSDLLTLSRLELISLGLDALSSRKQKGFFKGDLAYALMSLLRYRPRMDPTETLFQALARLSLANDSDRIVERAVAGVGDNDSVFLDGCQAASIHWKDVPPIYFHGCDTWKKRWPRNGWRTAPVWFIIGCVLVSFGDVTFKGIGAVFLIIGLSMPLYAPWAVQRMYSGKVWGSTPWLIGFEGVLPLKEVERLVFGNAVGRLSYAPSSNLFSDRCAGERIGKPPAWVEDPGLPKGTQPTIRLSLVHNR